MSFADEQRRKKLLKRKKKNIFNKINSFFFQCLLPTKQQKLFVVFVELLFSSLLCIINKILH